MRYIKISDLLNEARSKAKDTESTIQLLSTTPAPLWGKYLHSQVSDDQCRRYSDSIPDAKDILSPYIDLENLPEASITTFGPGQFCAWTETRAYWLDEYDSQYYFGSILRNPPNK